MIHVQDCRAVSRMVADGSFSELPWVRRWAVYAHLRLCQTCAKFAAQLGFVTDAAKARWGATPPNRLAELQRSLVEKLTR